MGTTTIGDQETTVSTTIPNDDEASASETAPVSVSMGTQEAGGTTMVEDATESGTFGGEQETSDDTSGAERVCTSESPCEAGQGLCMSDSDCASGLVCTPDAAAKLGLPGSSCLPAHCVNDQRDAAETSVDCGDGCGCRATYEVVEISGVPSDATFGQLSAMSGDGHAFAGTISRAGSRFSPPSPARIDARGVVTELPGLGASGSAFGINTDGSVLVGDLFCEDTSDCSTAGQYRSFRWENGQEPTAIYTAGSTALVVSTTGAIAAGTESDPLSGLRTAFRVSGNRNIGIPQLNTVIAISADGEFIAGRSSVAETGALWSATENDVIDLNPPSEWTSWSITVLNDDGSVFAGTAYVDGSPRAFIWQNGTFSDFPLLPGADYDNINGMSSDGSVTAGLSGTNSLQRAFLWDQTNGIRTVLAETAARGLELPLDLELISVDFLSDNADILVGWIYSASTPSFWRVTLLPS